MQPALTHRVSENVVPAAAVGTTPQRNLSRKNDLLHNPHSTPVLPEDEVWH